MILAAGLLVLLGLGLFIAGILTGVTALYWGCVAACVVAAVLLVLARRQMTAAPAAAAKPAASATGDAPPAAAPTTTTTSSAPTTTAPTTSAPAESPAGGSTAVGARAAADPGPVEEAAPAEELADPPVEEVEVTDLLLVVDLRDEVLVVDEHPRYHLAACPWLAGRTPVPLPVDEARTDGFTPCAACSPDRNLADRARARKYGDGS